jgi:hypothetical protein
MRYYTHKGMSPGYVEPKCMASDGGPRRGDGSRMPLFARHEFSRDQDKRFNFAEDQKKILTIIRIEIPPNAHERSK